MRFELAITGASGYVGSQLVEILSLLGCKVFPVYRNSVPSCAENGLTLNDLISGKISDSIDAVIHAAALARSNSYERLKAANEDLTQSIIEACKSRGVPLIFLSTVMASKGLGLYGKSKKRCEELIIKSELPSLILRLGPVFGDVRPNANSTISKLIYMIEHRSVVFVPFGAGPVISPTWVKDIAFYIVRWLNLNPTGSIIVNTTNEIVEYNILIKIIDDTIGVHRFKIPVPLKTLSNLAKIIAALPCGDRLPIDGLRFCYEMSSNERLNEPALKWESTPFNIAIKSVIERYKERKRMVPENRI